MDRLRITLLGGFRVTSAAGERITLKGRKPQALIAYLALNPGKPLRRDELVALLWGDRGEQQARSSLRKSLSELRQALAGEADCSPLIVRRDAVSLDAEAVEVDVTEFERLVDDGTHTALERAVELYQGDLIDGIGVHEPAFEDWLRHERGRLQERACEALSKLLDHQAAGDTGRAIVTARRLLGFDPLREATHRALMRLYAGKGERTSALKQYRACRDLLAAEFRLSPGPETEKLADEIRTGMAGTGEAVDPALEPMVRGGEPLSLPDKPSIAVLPFTNMSADPDQEYFSDGITEDIITGLSRFRELFVIARNSSFTFKGRPVKVQDIGDELGVRYIVEGSVRKAGNRVRITAQLIDAATGNHLWVERFDRENEDVFSIQDDVTKTVVATLAGRLGELGVDYAKRKATHSLTAFDYVLQARQLIYRYKRESILEARKLLEKAIALDPEYAIAHSWLSEVYWAEWLGGWTTNTDESFEQSTQAAAQAVALDDTDPQVHIQMGQICLNRRLYDESKFHFDKALSINPNEPNASMMYSYYSTCMGDPERAIAQINEAARIDPLGHYGYMEGIAHYTARNYDQAITAFKTVRGEAQSGRAWLAACHAQCGNLGDARTAVTEFVARTTQAMADMSVRPPARWSEFFAERHPYKHQEDMDHLLDGLSKAGLK